MLKKLQTINENTPLIYEKGKNDVYNEINEKSKITQTFESVDGVLNLPLISSIDKVIFYGETVATKISDDVLPRYSITEKPTNINCEKYNVNQLVHKTNILNTNKLLSLPGYDEYTDVLELENNTAIYTKNVYSITLTGADNEKWSKVSNRDNLYYLDCTTTSDVFSNAEMNKMLTGYGLLRETKAFSNWFGEMDSCCSQTVVNGWTIYNGVRAATGENIVRLFIQTDTITTLEELKTKLAKTPFTFYYLSIEGSKTISKVRNELQRLNDELADGTINTVKFNPHEGIIEASTDIITMLQNTGKLEVVNDD